MTSTVRRYYEDAYTTRFTARITDRRQVDGSPAVVLDETYFYPTSGGQPHDTGTLNGVPVVDVRVGEDGAVLHFLAAPLPLDVEQVQGEIDWPRRYDHMQQHSGQHLLSQVFYRLFGLETVSVHFGAAVSTLDLDTPRLDEAQLVQAEDAAYAHIWANVPIRTYWVDAETVAGLPLRRPPKVQGPIRIVEIQDFDWSACGGTHVARTGEIGPVALLRAERHRGRTRVHFLCGRRAALDARHRRAWLQEVARLLDTGPENAPERVAALLERLREQERALRSLKESLLDDRARRLMAQAERVGSVQILATQVDDLDANELKGLAQRLAEIPQAAVVLGAPSGERATLLFARGAQVPVDMGRLARTVLQAHGGGGGGRADFAQGGLPAASLAQALADAAHRLVQALQSNAQTHQQAG